TAGSENQTGRARTALIVLLVLGVLISGFGLSKNLPLSTILLFGAGASLMVMLTLNLSLVQFYVSDAMRGRVMSVYNVAFRGGMPLGSVICGFLIRQTSAPAIMTGNGVLVVTLALYFLAVQRKLTKL
ncbi:MAG: MFS transporter, partial [Acidobacteriaceae bacterium]|nr:MFS transporter [Acidobacteriaceae bacterium]